MFAKNIIIRYKFYVIAILISISVGTFLIFHRTSDNNPVVVDALEINKENEDCANTDNTLETYNIDIKGAVKNPGVYKVVKGSIINDVIDIAGGLKSNAYTNNINLSKRVSDEMVIYIFTKNEYSKQNSNELKSNINNNECSNSTYDISSCIKQGSSIATNNNEISNNPNNEAQNQNSLININTASKEELMTLTGIGESKALCIIEYREQNNGFKTIEEIMNISGIGEASFAKIKDSITV